MNKWIFALVVAVAGLVFTAPAPTAAQTANGVIWNVRYYDNFFLQGDPEGAGQLGGPLAIDWGPYEPSLGMPTNGWTATFEGDAYFPAGRYRFRMLVDDGARLRVSGIELFDTTPFEQHALGCAVYADMTLPEGIHKIDIFYLENEGNASLYFDWYPVPVINTNDPVAYGCNPPFVGDQASISEIRNNVLPASVGVPAQPEAATTPDAAPAPDAAPVTVASGSARVTAGTLNVRAQPASSGAVLGKVSFGDVFPVTGQAGDWIEIQYNGQTGYVSSRFVSVG